MQSIWYEEKELKEMKDELKKECSKFRYSMKIGKMLLDAQKVCARCEELNEYVEKHKSFPCKHGQIAYSSMLEWHKSTDSLRGLESWISFRFENHRNKHKSILIHSVLSEQKALNRDNSDESLRNLSESQSRASRRFALVMGAIDADLTPHTHKRFSG